MIRRMQKIVSSLLIIALVCLGMINSSVALATGNPKTTTASAKAINAKNDTQIIGQLTVIGSVTVNDKKALNGTSVFSNSRIKVACAKGNSAVLNLGRMGRVEIPAGTQVVLRFSDGLISGDLIEGNMMVNTPAGIKVSINTSDGVAATDGKEPAIMPVRTQRGVSCVPMVVSSGSSAVGLGPGPLAAMLVGAAGMAIGLAAITDQNMSQTLP